MKEEDIIKKYKIDTRINAEEEILQKADLVVTSTNQEVREQYGMYDYKKVPKFKVIPPGIDIETSSEEFKEIFLKQDTLVLSKGQGNFESLYDLELPEKEIYYLMKVKCNLMERIFKAKIGDLIFKKKT